MAKSDQRSKPDTQKRLDALLNGAFAGPPTPLKEVPTRTGRDRKLPKKTSAATASAGNEQQQSKNRA
jgi:hypothetical protein